MNHSRYLKVPYICGTFKYRIVAGSSWVYTQRFVIVAPNQVLRTKKTKKQKNKKKKKKVIFFSQAQAFTMNLRGMLENRSMFSLYFLTCPHKGRGIQISDIRFKRRGPQPIKLLLELKTFIFSSLELKTFIFSSNLPCLAL
jgi:hypothetical protein